MASTAEPLRREIFANEARTFGPKLPKELPILPSVVVADEGDPMDVSQSSNMGPPIHSQNGERMSENMHTGRDVSPGPQSNGAPMAVGAAAAASQPKVVQTAFIHKLYKWVTYQQIGHSQA